VAAGRLTQDSAFLAPTLNPTLSSTAATALPASSLGGRVDTFDGSVRVTATVLPVLRLNASYARNVRENRTAVQRYTPVNNDLFVDTPRSNTPFTFKRDHLKLGAEGDAPMRLKLSAGLDADRQERSYAEVVQTRETTVWGRAAMRPRDDLTLALRLAHGERARPTYGVATWFGTAENPLLRRFNLARRQRDTAGVRAEYSASEKLSFGASLDYADDQYPDSAVGLRSSRSIDFGADAAASLGERTHLTAYVQSQRMQARQLGSQQGGAADWTGLDKDRALAVGLTAQHSAIPDRLDIGASLTYAHSRNDLLVQATLSDPGFPGVTTARQSVRLFANYKLKDGLWIDASLAHEKLRSEDWRLDGVGPDTLANLLTFGSTPPRHELSVLRAGVRWQF
jgi:MtrB/PioB family decaheme-associated outer membrane protein